MSKYRVAKGIGVTPHLTPGFTAQLAAQISATKPGQAHFAGTGPADETCGKCGHLGYWQQVRNAAGDNVDTRHRGGCAKFFALTGKHGPVVPASASACRHFERRDG
jgi:hypothetical protein